MYDTILVATDGSEPADRAIDHALDIASTFDATLHALFVVDTRRYGNTMLEDSEATLSDLNERGRDVLSTIEGEAAINVTTELRNGAPHEQIDAYAREIDADLIVLGHRGLTSGDEIGSTAERVVRYAERPVITA
ncbi:universal stress protein [Natronolimnohabitans innermongolicus]|uniref:UspA domain-containing protein n=1 Tax=Natronolimnohabitans innermongolicus JCM 12255 TaxID=1227499 RepID=L9XAC2_9EURY|nr:universal stress protein [Natronolimnohabitans innermongolicus]ELY58704.1 UspA domain-containing protein [Natronolimnohabitans innermongolicus JCM 12255]